MKSDLSDIDSQMAEIKNRIYFLTQRMSEQGAMLTDLRDRITVCIEKDLNVDRRKKFTELQGTVTVLLREQCEWVREYKKLQKEYAELEGKKRSASKK